MRRILAIGWAICLSCGVLAVFMKPLTGKSGTAIWALAGAAIVATVVALLLRRKWDGVMTAGDMAVSAFVSGGGLGFLALGLATHRSLPIFLAIKWIAVGFLVCLIFRRQVIGMEKAPVQEVEFEWGPFNADSAEEMQEKLRAMTEEEKREALDRLKASFDAKIEEAQTARSRALSGLALFAIGAAVLASSFALTALLKG